MKMMNAASTSNPSIIVDVGEAYPYPSVIGPNFVTVKLSGKNKYNLWETQMSCLLKSHQMYGFIDGQFPRPAGNGEGKAGDLEAWIISDSLVKGWIFGSLSEEAAGKAVNHLTHMQQKTDFTAKDLWDELQRTYDPLFRERAQETKYTTRQAESVIEMNSISEDAKSKDEPPKEKTSKEKRTQTWFTRFIYDNVLTGDTDSVIYLRMDGLNPWDKLKSNGNTALHVAVGPSTRNHELLEKMLKMTPKENTDVVNSDGSSLLHVAAIGGNIKAVNMLVERNPELLLATDNEGHTPLALSVSNMHTKTSHCLFEHMKVYRYLLKEKEKEYDALLRGEFIMTCKTFEQQEKKYGDLNTGRKSGEDIKTSKYLLEQQEKEYDALFKGKSGEDLVILAISCLDFSLAELIINEYPDAILFDSDAVLTTLAQNFPRELNFWERRDFMEEVEDRTRPYSYRFDIFVGAFWLELLAVSLSYIIFGFFAIVTAFNLFPKAIVHPFIKDTSQVYKDAHSLLCNVCDTIITKDNSGTYHQYYNSSIFEATRRNSSTFIRWIMRDLPSTSYSIFGDQSFREDLQFTIRNERAQEYL